MIIDSQLEFSDAQAITADALSTNVIDLIGEGRGRSMNDQLWLAIDCVDAFDNLTTLDITLYTHTTTTVNSGHAVWTQQFALAELAAGQTLVRIKLPQRFYNSADDVFQGLEQYIGLYYDVTGTNPTAGSINASLVDSIDAPFTELS